MAEERARGLEGVNAPWSEVVKEGCRGRMHSDKDFKEWRNIELRKGKQRRRLKERRVE